MFVATTGGHLEQLANLAARIPASAGELWVTHANAQSRSLLSGRDVEFVPYVRVRNLPDVVRCLPSAHRLWRRYDITRVVSTGSGIALGYLPYLAARGVECHYIESAARVAAPSVTGRLLQRVPRVRRYTQYPHWAGSRWSFTGSVFDSYRAEATPRARADVLRAVVTVGTAAEFPFRRLISRLVPLLGPGGAVTAATGLPVEVLWQTGCTPTDGLPIDAVPFLPAVELGAALAAADIVVSHAGTGSALAALAAGRFPVLATRRAALGEAGDDHQGELADELVRRGLAARCEPETLTAADLVASMDTVVRSAHPPAFELAS
ncbi:glycosyltransferase family 28 [Pseudonocardia petroleophila]|uniref:Glycosyltransferase family 28 n=2 Tax=Pseudonocardia petroleophila TaxID=37331 RepID=A0A7G7MS45_9PSEU|nr:glycosyltransferase family 28 [Pseudonocardia petroleophila]